MTKDCVTGSTIHSWIVAAEKQVARYSADFDLDDNYEDMIALDKWKFLVEYLRRKLKEMQLDNP